MECASTTKGCWNAKRALPKNVQRAIRVVIPSSDASQHFAKRAAEEENPSVAAAMKLRNEQPSSLTVDSKCNFVFLSMIFTCIKWHKFFAHPDKHNKEHMDIEDYSRRMLLSQKCTEIVPAIRLINRLQFPRLVTACCSCCRRHWLQLPKKCSALTATTDINHPY
ncbi:hypothetical protein T09_5477 [Trichinella sp. T9]|nr:hypothetical protein T09_5477 [Trichinella sp. T9]